MLEMVASEDIRLSSLSVTARSISDGTDSVTCNIENVIFFNYVSLVVLSNNVPFHAFTKSILPHALLMEKVFSHCRAGLDPERHRLDLFLGRCIDTQLFSHHAL
jgi:hypothetical protein